MAKKVVVVGAGPGGLASAMLLARAGLDVTVVERNARVGGRTSAIEEEGFRFDVGPTFFLYPRILNEIFEACGFRLRDELPMKRLDPQYRLLFGGGGEIRATADVARMEAEIAAIAPGDAPKFRTFLSENRSKLEAFRPILERPFGSWTALLDPSLLGALPWLRPTKSVDSDLSRYFADPRIRLAFSFQSKYLGMSPFRCPSLFTILSFLEYEHGVYHPIGGCNAVSDAMARCAERLGVKIRLGEPVEEIVFRGRRVVGVRTAAAEYASDSLVLNADFARAMERLIPDGLRRRWTNRKIAEKKFSCSTFMLYLGIEGRYDAPHHHNIYIAEDYRRNLDDIERRHVLSDDPSVYVQNASVTDPTLAPAGMSTLYVLAPVTHRHPNVDWAKEKERFRSVVLRQVERLGFPGVEERIRFEKCITPDDWDRSFEIHKGATFNLAHNLGQMLHLRPRNRFEDLDGMYLVGGGTHPGSGLPVIFESARISSRLLLEDMGLDNRWAEIASSVRAHPDLAEAV